MIAGSMYRIAEALKIIAKCQLKQTQIIEQSFKENKKEAERAERIYKLTEEMLP